MSIAKWLRNWLGIEIAQPRVQMVKALNECLPTAELVASVTVTEGCSSCNYAVDYAIVRIGGELKAVSLRRGDLCWVVDRILYQVRVGGQIYMLDRWAVPWQLQAPMLQAEFPDYERHSTVAGAIV